MKCIYCENEMIRGHPPFPVDQAVYVSLDNVPVWFCAPCKEICVEEAEGYF